MPELNKQPWGLYAIVAACVIYIGWSLFGKIGQKPSDGFQPGKPAINVDKVPGPVVNVPVQVLPKDKVKKKVKNAPPIKDSEEWVDSVDVPKAPNGATVLTKIDTVTGEVSNDVKINPAPWFAFERDNTFGAGYEIGTQGAKVPVYYRRGVARVKDFHLVGEVGGKVALDPREKSEAHATGLIEYRW